MGTTRRDNSTGIPRWSAPWAAGWSAMSDISRIETEKPGFGLNREVQHSRAKRRVSTVGLAAGLVAVYVAAALWL